MSNVLCMFECLDLRILRCTFRQHSIDNNKLRCRVEELIDEVAMKEADIENARQVKFYSCSDQ